MEFYLLTLSIKVVIKASVLIGVLTTDEVIIGKYLAFFTDRI